MSNQLVKKNPAEGYQNVFPKTWIDAIKDKESGVSLQEILQGFNMYFLSYNGSRALTRCKVPSILRKEGLWITYVLYDHTVVTEWYNSDQIDDSSWSMDSNWRVASNFLVGDVSVSTDGYWVINGEKTEAKAQGKQGVTPLLRVGTNNKLQVSYNAGKVWKDISDYIVPRFKWNQGVGTTAGTIQISMDLGKTWTNLSNEITNNLRISRYIGINESLPTSGVAEGTIYMKGPYYDEGDTSNTNPIYRMWIYAWKGNTLAWQDNGEFTSISAGVVQERGTSTTEVMSQDAVTRELTKLGQEIDNTVSGKYLNRYGKPVEDADWSYSDYIPYTQGNQVEVRFSKGTANANAAIPFYDSNYKQVEFWLCNSATGNTFISAGNIPSTAAYLRYSFKTSDIDDVYCVIGNTKIKPGGIINDFNYYKLENADNLSYKKNNVFYGDAIANTDIAEGLKKRILSALKFVRIEGYTDKINLVISEIKLVAYSAQIPLRFSAIISKIDNGNLVNVCSLSYVVTDISNWQGIVNCNIDNLPDLDVIDASMTVDLNALGTELFNLTLVTSVESDTFEKYGLSYDCIVPIRVDTSMFTGNNVPIRYQVALKSMIIDNLDTTRNYKLKKFNYDRNTGLLTISLCTDENLLDILYSSVFDTSKAVGVKWVETAGWKALIDFNIMNNSVKTIALNYQSIANSLDVCLLSGIRDSNLSAGEELTLTYNNEPLRVLDCGKLTGKFYLNCGRKIFTTEHIVKQTYVANDAALTLLYEFPDTVTRDQNVYERFEYINGIRELNTGKVLVNVAIQTADNEQFENLNRGGTAAPDIYSKYYMWDGTNMNYLFEGGYAGANYGSGLWVKRGGACTMVWDFSEWENYIFVSERNGQGYGGKAWMSNDYGTTWYLIFNAYPNMNWIYKNPPYPFRNPSGFDPDNGDFDRQVGGKPNFHIHGIAYDHWRNQVIIVSGDATHVKGSYTAVWVWRIPQTLTLWPEQTYEGGYSGTEVYPLGGTKADNPVKMLANTWTRVGLHQNETHMEGGNMQFVGVIPFKNYIAFTTDNNHLGGNGIIINTYPENIVSTNFKIVYPLSPDSEGITLTHCGGGYMFIENLCLVTLHRENSSGMIEGSDRRAAVLASTDGYTWKRLYIDDTLDAELHTKISWGATMIGKDGELYLRYKGFKPEDNKIRVMRLY